MAKRTKNRHLDIKCGGCGRHLDAGYSGWPSDEVDPSMVHFLFDPSAPPSHSFHCTCGHYTMYSPIPASEAMSQREEQITRSRNRSALERGEIVPRVTVYAWHDAYNRTSDARTEKATRETIATIDGAMLIERSAEAIAAGLVGADGYYRPKK